MVSKVLQPGLHALQFFAEHMVLLPEVAQHHAHVERGYQRVRGTHHHLLAQQLGQVGQVEVVVPGVLVVPVRDLTVSENFWTFYGRSHTAVYSTDSVRALVSIFSCAPANIITRDNLLVMSHG